MKFHPEFTTSAGRAKHRSARSGLTLVELMVVLAIIIILATLSSLALRSLGGSTSLDGASDLTGDLLNYARQEAISKNTLAAVLIDTNLTTGSSAYSLMGVWEYTASNNTWVQASKWRLLPAGIVVDNTSTNFVSSSISGTTGIAQLSTTNTFAYPGGTLAATSLAAYIYEPSGRLYLYTNPAAYGYTLKLVEGRYASTTATAPTYSRPSTNPAPTANYVQYYFSTANGVPKVYRH